MIYYVNIKNPSLNSKVAIMPLPWPNTALSVWNDDLTFAIAGSCERIPRSDRSVH